MVQVRPAGRWNLRLEANFRGSGGRGISEQVGWVRPDPDLARSQRPLVPVLSQAIQKIDRRSQPPVDHRRIVSISNLPDRKKSKKPIPRYRNVC